MVTQERHGSCHLQIQQGCEFYAGSTRQRRSLMRNSAATGMYQPSRATPRLFLIPTGSFEASVGDDPRGFSLRYLANLRWPSYRKRKNA
jgi:hypothetical protein